MIKDKFDEEMKPVLASRIIGGFWDAKTNNSTDLKYHYKLKENFLKNKLY